MTAFLREKGEPEGLRVVLRAPANKAPFYREARRGSTAAWRHGAERGALASGKE